MPESEPVLPILQDLIDKLAASSTDRAGGEYRRAQAQLETHSILATNRAAVAYESAGKGLEKVTRNLATATWILAIATLALGVITACSN